MRKRNDEKIPVTRGRGRQLHSELYNIFGEGDFLGGKVQISGQLLT